MSKTISHELANVTYEGERSTLCLLITTKLEAIDHDHE